MSEKIFRTDEDDSLLAELRETQRALTAARGELFKAQIVSGTRLDVIRLLAFISNRGDIPDLSGVVPDGADERAVFARELQELAKQLRARASNYDEIVARLCVT